METKPFNSYHSPRRVMKDIQDILDVSSDLAEESCLVDNNPMSFDDVSDLLKIPKGNSILTIEPNFLNEI